MKRFRSERLTAARLELGLTQEQAAQAVEVDVRTYRRYESGEVNAGGPFNVGRVSRRTLLAQMERELGLGLDELVGDDEPTHAGLVGETAPMPFEGAHVLPRARHVIAREPLESTVVGWLQRTSVSSARVLVLHAIGGAGKTTLLASALERAARPAFVWSFYEDPRTEAFLDAVSRAFDVNAPGDELSERALRALRESESPLLALDGLETMQATGASSSGRARGELEDPRMRLLLRHLARGVGSARAIITTRTPLSDLESWEGAGLESHALPALGDDEARAIIERWGAAQADAEALARRAGGHALSAAVIGSLAATATGETRDAATTIDLEEAATHDVLAARLSRTLATYSNALSPLDRDVLRRACALTRGVNLATLNELARGSDEAAGALRAQTTGALRASLQRLAAMGLLTAEGETARLTAHPFVRQHFQRELGQGHRCVHEALRKARSDALTSHGHEGPESTSLDALEALLEHTLRAGDAEGAFKLYANVLGGFGRLGLERGDMSRGLRITRLFATDSITGAVDPILAEAVLSPSSNARVHYDLGLFTGALGDLAAALTAYQNVIDIAVRAGDRGFHLTALRTLGYTMMLRGSFEKAERAVTLSIELARSFDSVGDEVRGKALLGAIRSHAGDHEGANELFQQVGGLGDKPIARRGLWEAEHVFRCGDLDEAGLQTKRNLEVCTALGWHGHVAHCHALLGSIACARGHAEEAESHLTAALPWTHHSSEAEMVLRTAALELSIARARGTGTTEVLARGTELASLGGFRLFPDFLPR